MNILNIGVNADYEPWLKDKIKLTNLLTLIISGICLFFTVISLLFLKPIAYLPIIAFFVVSSSFILTWSNLHILSRYIIVSTPFILSIIYNASIANETHAPLYAMWGLTIAFSIPIFIIFDYRELKYPIIGFILLYGFVLGFDQINLYFDEHDIDYEFTNGLFFTILCTSATFCIVMGLLVYQQVLFKKSEDENNVLIKGFEEQQIIMQQNEIENQKTLEALKIEKIKDEQRKFISDGLTEINNIFRNTSDSSTIYDEVLAYIIRYTQALQGGIFIANKNKSQEETNLILEAAYAYNRKKVLEKTVDIGEGLVGQCYIEKDKIYLSELPEAYVTITSGLGECNPTNLIILPLIYNSQIEGVIEISAFNKLEDYHIEFIEKAGETIASFVKTNKVNKETNELLNLSKIQEEQLRAQEEEMRQNLEELQATLEEANRKEQDLLDKIASLQN